MGESDKNNVTLCSYNRVNERNTSGNVGGVDGIMVNNNCTSAVEVQKARLSHGRGMSNAVSRFSTSEEEVTAVYTECISLSAAGKISTKNAFGLRLIDFMSQLIKPTDNINFKLASCALDAGAKIYGHRVDYVQAEAQKVASGLVIALEADKSNGDENDSDGEPTAKKRKIIKKTKTIATNIQSLNVSKVELNTPPDPLFSSLSSSFDIGNVNGLLMSNLALNDNGLLLLNTNEIKSTNCELAAVKIDRSSILSIWEQKPQIVPQLFKFEFCTRLAGLDYSSSTFRAGSQDKPSFNLGAGLGSQPFEASLDPQADDHHSPGDIFDEGARSDGDDEVYDTTVNENLNQSVSNHFSMRSLDSDGFSKLIKALSDQPSEYTYFNKELLGVWAGPEHWKLNPLAKKGAQKAQAQKVSKSTRKQKNVFSEIDFNQPLPVDGYDKKDTQLKVPTISKWTDRLLPNDISYEPMKLIKPFLRESTTFSILKKIHPYSGDAQSHFSDNDSERDYPGLDGGMDNHFDDEFPQTQECFPNQYLDGGTYAPFSGDNLVDEPYAVTSTALPFSTHAKKIDVKRLKREMWTIVTSCDLFKPSQASQNDESSSNPTKDPSTSNQEESSLISSNMLQTSELDNPDNINDALTFSNMYKKLPDRVGNTMAANLSVAIAFVALLHLTNEKNLKLQGKTDLTDFIIKPEIIES